MNAISGTMSNELLQDHAVVYVDDDLMSREALGIILSRVMKIPHVTLFEDSRDILNRLRALPVRPDVVLLDIHMLPHNGFEVLKMLRADAAFASARVIALTASVMNEEVELLKQSGFDGVIGKPINVASFPRLIQRVIAGETIWHVTDI